MTYFVLQLQRESLYYQQSERLLKNIPPTSNKCAVISLRNKNVSVFGTSSATSGQSGQRDVSILTTNQNSESYSKQCPRPVRMQLSTVQTGNQLSLSRGKTAMRYVHDVKRGMLQVRENEI